MHFEDLRIIASGKYTIKGLTRELGLSEEEVRGAIKKFNIPYQPPKYKKWFKEDDDLIIEMTKAGKPNYRIALSLDRTEEQIQIRKSKLKIGYQTLNKWSEKDLELLIFLKSSGALYKDISEVLNRSIPACTRMYQRLKKEGRTQC
ncbi:MAG: hypothetical protein ACRCZ2_00570 [Fusobacteriaceae bacterium]